MNELVIRMATEADVPSIMEIYRPYIQETAITFEYEEISLEEFTKRMRKIQQQFPWLVCESEGAVVGYAYCSQFKERAAFAWDCECSVYIHKKAQRMGIATMLYTKLFELMKEQGYFNIYALITYPNESSVKLHKNFGFHELGIYKNTGYKLDRWWDLLVMEKQLRSYDEAPERPKSILELSDLV